MKLLRTIAVGSVLLVPLLAAAQGTGTSDAFIPLLPSLPGISSLQNSNSLAPFLSQIYKICIGLAAVLAVLQLMRAGVMYMGGDSITEKKEARNLIAMSIIGLILVLSPVIVFRIINPNILNLNINTESLATQIDHINPTNDLGQSSNAANNAGGSTIAPAPTNPGCTAQIQNSQLIDDTGPQKVCCESQTKKYSEYITASCQVDRRNRFVNGESVSVPFCGCSLSTQPLNYYNYILKEVRGLSGTTETQKGPVPKQLALHTSYVNDCKAAGGVVEEKNTEGFFSSKTCPADSGLSSEKTYLKEGDKGSYNQYLCVSMTATCKAK